VNFQNTWFSIKEANIVGPVGWDRILVSLLSNAHMCKHRHTRMHIHGDMHVHIHPHTCSQSTLMDQLWSFPLSRSGSPFEFVAWLGLNPLIPRVFATRVCAVVHTVQKRSTRNSLNDDDYSKFMLFNKRRGRSAAPSGATSSASELWVAYGQFMQSEINRLLSHLPSP